ncbi:hypothetical protein VTL71DRAFT_4220 [Oculimacula yallundae]|uniref:Uncharacterized protein n=1 Tax=Oculimacula yallundae TaxID=86028 RepID=A0ABR4C5Y5_9HELO
MQLHILFVLIGIFSFAVASPSPQVSLPATTTSLSPSHYTASSQLSSYFAALATDIPFQAALDYLSTNTTASVSLSVFEASISSVFANRETLASDYLNGIPDQVRPFFSSVYAAEASILNVNGLGTPLTNEPAESTETDNGEVHAQGQAKIQGKKGAASRETGLGRGTRAAVVGAVGFVCVVVAL